MKTKKLFLLIAAIVTIVFVIMGCNPDTGNGTGVNNPAWAAICKVRAQNAQYMPDAGKLVASDNMNMNPLSGTNTVMRTANEKPGKGGITLEEYNALVSDISTLLYHPYADTIERPFNIDYVKEEATAVFENITVFDAWVLNPTLKAAGGWTRIMPMGRYYLQYNSGTGHITIFGAGWVIGRYADDAFVSRIDYYYNENGKEVIEYQISSVSHNQQGAARPFSSVYFKNIEDTSFVKISIDYSIADLESVGGAGFGLQYKGPDVYETYGIKRSFVQIDYTDPENMTILNIQQQFYSAYGGGDDYFEGTARNFRNGIEKVLYNIDDDPEIINASILKMMFNLGTAETTVAKFTADAASGDYGASYGSYFNDLLNDIVKGLVDNDFIMTNWAAGVKYTDSLYV